MKKVNPEVSRNRNEDESKTGDNEITKFKITQILQQYLTDIMVCFNIQANLYIT